MMPKLTSSPERVLSPRQTKSFDRLVYALERPMANMPSGMRGRSEGSAKKEVHFHSPTLVFPNIRNEEDAEAFVRNLSDLAG